MQAEIISIVASSIVLCALAVVLFFALIVRRNQKIDAEIKRNAIRETKPPWARWLSVNPVGERYWWSHKPVYTQYRHMWRVSNESQYVCKYRYHDTVDPPVTREGSLMYFGDCNEM